MDVKAFPALIVGVVVALVLAGAVLPVFAETTSATDTFTNEGIINAKLLNENSNTTLTWNHLEPKIITVDGTQIDMSTIQSEYPITILFSNDWFVRYLLSGQIQVFLCGTTTSSTIVTATPDNQRDMTIAINNGSATLTFVEEGADNLVYDYGVTGAGLIISAEKSDYVLKSASDRAFVKESDVFYGIGRTERALGTSGTSFNIMFSATIEGMTPLYYSPQYTISDQTSIDYSDVNTHIGLYSLKGLTFNLASNDVLYPITYSQIFVPSEVTTEKSVHPDGPLTVILNVLPLLAIAGLVTGAVVWFINRKG